jgi:hypothetical protein
MEAAATLSWSPHPRLPGRPGPFFVPLLISPPTKNKQPHRCGWFAIGWRLFCRLYGNYHGLVFRKVLPTINHNARDGSQIKNANDLRHARLQNGVPPCIWFKKPNDKHCCPDLLQIARLGNHRSMATTTTQKKGLVAAVFFSCFFFSPFYSGIDALRTQRRDETNTKNE